MIINYITDGSIPCGGFALTYLLAGGDSAEAGGLTFSGCGSSLLHVALRGIVGGRRHTTTAARLTCYLGEACSSCSGYRALRTP